MRDERIPDFRLYSIPLRLNFLENEAMKKIILFCSALAAVACTLEEVGGRPQNGKPQDGKDDVWVKPGEPDGSGNEGKTVTYITAFDYPEGYDWRADMEKGTVKCSLVVYADGVPAMKIPVGDEYEVSSDPDMHRMVNGHLYTDYSTDSETVIKKDGKEIIRYPGREMIVDLTVKGDDVYTLGHKREGRGFVYRKNGESVLERSNGYSFGRFYHAHDEIVRFAFAETVDSADRGMERYYVSEDGEVSQTAVREDVKKVWDVAFCGGEICYLASVVGIPSPVLFRCNEMKALNIPESSEMLTCRIITSEDALYVEGLCRSEGKPLTSGIWHGDGQIYFFSDGTTVSNVCTGGEGLCCIMNRNSDFMKSIIYRCGTTYPVPMNYASVGSSSILVVDGILNVGLSSLAGEPPLLWKDGETTSLKINGFISTISTNKD